MTAKPNCIYVSPEKYLESEKYSPIKHEYINGEIYAMAGASKAHATISLNLASLLRNRVRGTGCRTYISDMKVRIPSANIFYYPDVVVTCDARDRNSEDFIQYPCLIVEVLSPTTEAFDRGNKFADYRTIETLQEYVIINQEKLRVECYRLNDEGRWELYFYKDKEQVCLVSINFSCAIEEIYEDV